jgi:hypothetical protein
VLLSLEKIQWKTILLPEELLMPKEPSLRSGKSGNRTKKKELEV